MKKHRVFRLLFSLAFLGYSYSQQQVVNSIRDYETNDLIQNVLITSISNDSTYICKDGTFTISKSGQYTFTKEGYIFKAAKLKIREAYTVKMYRQPSNLNEVIIYSNYLPAALNKTTSSIGLITSSDIERANNININESLNRISGVFMQTGALNTNRITIRGVGSRNLFGTSKIRAYLNNIPLTNGSGETSLEDFELGAISRIEITKGATSSIYGAGLGGVIQLIPKKSSKGVNIDNEITVGSFGLIKYLTQFGFLNKNTSMQLAYSVTGSDGYRENNNYKRQNISLNYGHQLNSNSELSILALFSDLKAFIPSSLNENDFRNNPQSATFTWRRSMGFEDTKRGVFGASLRYQLRPKLEQNTSLFGSFRNSFEPRPFNILDENVFGYGLRHNYSGNFKIGEKTIQWISGLEYFKDKYKYQTFENLYQDFPEGTGSIQGGTLSSFEENRQYYNLFFEGNYALFKQTTLVFGANFNKTSYDLEDKFPVSIDNPDQSGSFKFKGIFSPKLGALQNIAENSNLYANISHGFSPLSLQEVLLPNGQVNNNLNPETGWNFEIGAKGSIFQNRLTYNVSLYRLSIKNLLVARRTAEDAFVGINAGKTNHDGLETDFQYRFINNENLQISLFGSYSLNHYKFKDFVDGDNDFSGNDLTGVPSNILNLGCDFDTWFGFYGNFNYQYVGEMPITDSNSLFSENYQLSNFKIGYKKSLNNQLDFDVFLGVNNIFNESYASQILINATGFGGNLPRYFYPGNPVNYYSGLSLNYLF